MSRSSGGPKNGPKSGPKNGPKSDKTTRAFVDALEANEARLLDESGQHAFTVPAALLPPGTAEGSWVTITIAPSEPPASSAALRRKLTRDDDGGDFSL